MVKKKRQQELVFNDEVAWGSPEVIKALQKLSLSPKEEFNFVCETIKNQIQKRGRK